ncbi:histone-lysine N-methyltransferase SUVR3 isoform X2 [Lathyrus oleraceus]|nr:histone-lysine N-methyltransferase SUVR3 isoform X2 [Pisum sativum]
MIIPNNVISYGNEDRETEMKISKNTSNRNSEESLLVQNADLILPWLTHQQLANLSLTSKSLHKLTQTLTLNRISDASRNFENFPIPFLNNNNDHNVNHPYSYFLYTPSLLSTTNIPRYQPWGGNSVTSTNPKTIDNDHDESVSFVDVVGCDCGEVCGDGCVCFGFYDDVGRECGPSCFCEVGCGNRVSQNGVAVRVKIVRCGEKGWGLFADQVIPKGQFLFHYAGVGVVFQVSVFHREEIDNLRTSLVKESNVKRFEFRKHRKAAGMVVFWLSAMDHHLPSTALANVNVSVSDSFSILLVVFLIFMHCLSPLLFPTWMLCKVNL